MAVLSRDAIRLLRRLSKQLDDIDGSDKASDRAVTHQHVVSDEEKSRSSNDVDDREEEFYPPPRTGIRAPDPDRNHRVDQGAIDVELIRQELRRAQVSHFEEKSFLEARIKILEQENEQIRSENARLVHVCKKATNRAKERERRVDLQIQQSTQLYLQEVERLEVELELAQNSWMEERAEIEYYYREQLHNCEGSWESWARDLERDYFDRLSTMEEDKHLIREQFVGLQKELKLTKLDKKQLEKEFDRKILEFEVQVKQIKLDFAEELREVKEVKSIESRKRVSKALDDLQL